MGNLGRYVFRKMIQYWFIIGHRYTAAKQAYVVVVL